MRLMSRSIHCCTRVSVAVQRKLTTCGSAKRHFRSLENTRGFELSRRSLAEKLLTGLAVHVGFNRNSRAMAATQSKIEKILEDPQWPETFPLTDEAFGRYDESSDSDFYNYPRFVTHIDDNAIKALTQFYADNFPPSGQQDVSLLDICSSWISHYPPGYKAARIAGLGMNEAELAKNEVLSDYLVADLNVDPKLPYPDNTFDVVTNAVSVDYLTKPIQVFQEMHRVMKPGGMAIMSFSNRCFPTKAIAVWTSTSDEEHIWLVGW